jgi:glyoxylase-like metal-dependent hydrolase (beta-lactamase superfamily II)
MTEIFRLGVGYLLRGESGAVLVDAGEKATPERVRELAGNVPVRLVLLTHAHFDHMATAGMISRTLRVPIALHPADRPLLMDGYAQAMNNRGLPGRILRFFSQRMVKRMVRRMGLMDFTPTIDLEDGMSLAEYGVDAVVIALPGHTAGSVGVLVNGRELLVGDAMMHMLRITPALIFENERDMLWSVERIRSSRARRVYVGHGKPFDIRKV